MTSYLPKNIQVLFYVVSAAGSTYWAYNEVSHELYSLFIDANPSPVQRGLLCVSMWCGLVASIFLIYYKKLSLIRSIFVILAIVAALFSVDSSLVMYTVLTQSLTHSLSHSLTGLLTYSLTRTYLLTHSLTHSLTYSLTYSLTH